MHIFFCLLLLSASLLQKIFTVCRSAADLSVANGLAV